ncbi:anthranilate synthase component II [Mergibacter septicus]|uniref:anthranilate synthase component II n=1 Tax=Mergibacter septicus TaxID=221402 RepID=UPI001C759055|nr:anthranilate synthase component II [Mergibacter septicus]QDJ12398.1 anthranilate synthase component II [Mergibacter septicus]
MQEIKLLVVDNNDSFTYNLVELLRQLQQELGLEITVCPVGELNLAEVDRYTHILLSPGADVPMAYPQMFSLLADYHQTKSILGVCLGHQTLCQFFGGHLYNLGQVRHGRNGRLQQLAPSPLFTGLPSDFEIGLYHSWAISQQDFPQALEITALCNQGIIMAVQHRQYPLYGVQFHPESFITQQGKALLKNWLLTTRNRQKR